MKVLLAFLFLAFVLGLRSGVSGKRPRFWLLLGLAFVVGAGYSRLGVI